MLKVAPFEVVTGPPCARCGCTGWLVDGDMQGRWWLLCLGMNEDLDCGQTLDLPAEFSVISGGAP